MSSDITGGISLSKYNVGHMKPSLEKKYGEIKYYVMAKDPGRTARCRVMKNGALITIIKWQQRVEIDKRNKLPS